MALIREPAARRGRRLLAAMAAVACLLSVTASLGGASGVRADPGAAPIAPLKRASPTPTLPPAPTVSPSSTCFFGPDFCPPSPSPSPVLVVVSPVPPDPSPTHTIPSYLQGINPSPTPIQPTTDSITSAVPIAGGFVDQLPGPSATAEAASPNDLAPHSSGVPLPFLAAGALLILAAIGSLLYAVAPRNKPIFDATRRPAPATSVRVTPYGPEGPGATTLTGPKPPRGDPKGRG